MKMMLGYVNLHAPLQIKIKLAKSKQKIKHWLKKIIFDENKNLWWHVVQQTLTKLKS